MRRGRGLLVILVMSLSACSLFTSLDGFTGGADDRVDGGDGGAEGSSPDAQADGSADATTDTTTTPGCDLSKPFGAHDFYPSPINQPSSKETAGALSSDGLSLYFCSDRPNAAGGDRDLYVAKRASVGDAWGAVAALDTINTPAYECDPYISTDELTIYFDSNRGGGMGNLDIWVATRSSRSAPFGTPSPVPVVNGAQDDFEPWLGASGLYFASGTPTPTLFLAKRSGTGFAPPLSLGLQSGSGEETPMPSADERILYFASQRPGGQGDFDIWMAQRSSANADFGAPKLVPELNSSQGDYPVWISPDGCALIVQTYAVGSSDIFYVTRPQ